MLNKSHSQYIKIAPKPNRFEPNKGRSDAPPSDMLTAAMYLDNEYPKGAFYLECDWFWKAYPDKVFARAHIHDWDEMISFFGSNPKEVTDLGGEIEFWIEDEKFILEKSCTVFIPKGMKHCPVIVKRVDRPIFHFTTGLGGKYESRHV
jgi:hypothetical protein